jgi:hypothetical protein
MFLVLIALPGQATAQSGNVSLGTLFYSSSERAAIIALRRTQLGVVTSPGTSISVGGLVRRASGKGAAWINGQMVAEGHAVASAGVPVIEARQVVVDGHPVRVRETVDIESGARSDALPAGAVSIRRQK